MELHTLSRTTKKANRRLGQGHGSGRVKTAGRGTKGTKARSKVPIRFEGGALPLIKRLPYRRGKGRNDSFKRKPIGLNVSLLNTLPAKTTVDIEMLVKHNMVEKDIAATHGVKILGNGEITVALTLLLPATKQAAAKIEKAGGTVGR